MAIIQSGASADLWTIDTTSKAGRATLYDSAGFEVRKPGTSYLLPINLVFDNAMGAGETVWAMRYVTGALTVKIRRIRLVAGFNGTAAAATSVAWRFKRFDSATPTGGTAITVVKKRTAYAGSVVTDARFDSTGTTGLTVAGLVFGSEWHVISLPASVTNGVVSQTIDLVLPGERFGEFDLASGEGLAIQMDTASIAGNTLTGSVEWDEVS